MKTLPILILVLLLYFPVAAETTISGNIGGKVFTPSGNPWIVTENIIIDKDKTAEIKAGCVFLFKPFTSIEVHGKLIVNGSSDTSVVFTSYNDDKYNQSAEALPNPFDWNGIVINEDAGDIQLSKAIISFSVFGIKAQKNDVSIKNCTFRQNGQFHFTVLGEIQPVSEGYKYSYSNKSREKTKEDTNNLFPQWQRPLGISLTVLGTGFTVAGIYCFFKRADYLSRYNSTSDQQKMNDYYSKAGSMKNFGIASMVAGGIFLPAGLVITFKKSAEQTALSVTSYFGPLSCAVH